MEEEGVDDDALVADADAAAVAAAVASGAVDRAFLEGAPGAELLSAREKELCVKLKFLPK